MGIPKFYRWTSERYPCLYEKIREYQIPEFDNLYLDMNGIIHNCSHPNDEDIHLRIPEESIFKDIFRYIEFLFRMIKPCKVFFMAVDGVAPRAKMNQQRGRRFRSARVAEEQEAEAIRQGEKLPSEDRFDSNCITPGTEFMARLHEQLKYFVSVKVSTDPLWQRKGLCIYLSGHDVPGEGEHKVMDFIRHIRSKPDYNPETRHCLYGLDADLMMLGLSTHELRFSLLREEVKFSKPKKKKNGNPPKQKSKFNKNKEDKPAAYDLTNVSVFTTESNLGISGNSIFKAPTTVDLNPDSSVRDGKSFLDAMYATPTSSSGVVKVERDPRGVEKVARNPLPPNSNGNQIVNQPPPPPSADDHNAKGDYKAPLPEKTTFFLLHLSLFRDYLDEEFKELRDNLVKHPKIKYNLECVIDDWILMNILVGNDFVPHLPNLHIVKGALPMLYRTYMEVLPQLDGYLNENGLLNLKRFEVFIKKLSQFDLDLFKETYDDMKYKASKTGKNIVLGEKMFEDFLFEDPTPFEEEELEPISDELRELAKRTEDEIFGDSSNPEGKGLMCKEVFPEDNDFFSEEDTEEFRLEFLQHKRNYYLTKCEFKRVDRPAVHGFAEEYVRAIQWVLLYYYKGVSSWGWFYPSHYAPYASDLRGFGDFNIEFMKGQPFKPFEQLLAVLPSQSKKLLPRCYQWLMTEDSSPILDYYPKKFEQDLNGKKQDWEAVVLIPFIDESKLLTAMDSELKKLTGEETFRNARGHLLCYSYTKENTGVVKSYMNLFPEVEESHIKLVKIDEVDYDPHLLPKGLHPKANIKKIYQGFPSLKSKTFVSTICKADVKVFEFYAREESLILSFEEIDEETDGMKLGKKVLGKQVWVNWPHLEAAMVSAVYTRFGKYILGRDSLVIKDPRTTEDGARKNFDVLAKTLVEKHLKFRGIKLGNLHAILNAKLLEGRKIRCNNVGKVVIENQWSKLEQPFALKTAIFEERVTEMFYMDEETAKSYVDLFRKGDQVFYLGDKLFGAMGSVTGHEKGSGSVVVELKYPKETDESNLKLKTGLTQLKSQDFFPSYETAAKCQISSFALSRLTGRVLATVEKPRKQKRSRKKKPLLDGEEGSLSGSESSESSTEDFPALEPEISKLNIGLDLKFNKTNMEVRGYTSKRDGQWTYSLNTIKLVNEYVRRFPEIVLLLGGKSKDVYTAEEIFPGDKYANDKVLEIVNWLEDSGVRNLPRIPTNCNVLDDEDIEKVWKFVSKQSIETTDNKQSWTVRPNLLYKPGLDKGCIAPIPNAEFALLDRVICVDRGASVPLGVRGTVVGIQTPPKSSNDENEEGFKSVSADALNLLIIMCDPTTDIFDKPSYEDSNKENGGLTALTGSLAKLLGVNGAQPKVDSVETQKPADVPPISLAPTVAKQQQPPLRPKLVKLFPYQVINLTQGAGNLRQDLKKTAVTGQNTNKDRSSLINGTAIIKAPISYAQKVAGGGTNENIKVTRILRNPENEKVRGAANNIPPLIPKQQQKSQQTKQTLPWPPQPKGYSLTVEQLFAQAALSQDSKPSHTDSGPALHPHDPRGKQSTMFVPTQILKRAKPSQSPPKKVAKEESKPYQKKENPIPPSSRLLNFTLKELISKPPQQDKSSTNSGTEQVHHSKGRVFVNSAFHQPKSPKKDSMAGDRKSEKRGATASAGEPATQAVQQPMPNQQLFNCLFQQKNLERLNSSSSNDQGSSSGSWRSNASDDTHAKNGYARQHIRQNIPASQGQFQHPINVPTFLHPVDLVQQQLQTGLVFHQQQQQAHQNMYGNWVPNPLAPDFSHHHFQAQVLPPQNWSKQQPTMQGQGQSFRQMTGTKTANVFVPLQVSRSMATGDSESNGNINKKNTTTEVDSAAASVPHSNLPPPAAPNEPDFKPNVMAKEFFLSQSSNNLKALLGVNTSTQDETNKETVPQPPKPSRMAANFPINQPS